MSITSYKGASALKNPQCFFSLRNSIRVTNECFSRYEFRYIAKILAITTEFTLAFVSY
ncbi:hypothetical protein GCM10007852_17120 [Agaribacter marinus]|uniref:Uncharacterized protein n=1 Tax=Agaribacter marinus TaxID=1431249 RepID=A0AA37WK01_9ALTE|nr:hypothetical protein GCM10007852_17120 [Agaribacter marinus]